ncbi:MAG: cytochrome c biogenesis protein ResB [Anaerolineae bacterium]
MFGATLFSGAAEPWMRRAWRALGSTHLSVWLLLTTAFLVLLGTCLPQQPWPTAQEANETIRWRVAMETRYGAGVSKALERLGLLDLYHSPLFLATLGALALNGLSCTVQRAGRRWRIFRARPRAPLLGARAAEAEWNVCITFAGGTARAEEAVRAACRKARLRLRSQPWGEATAFMAQAGHWRVLGTVVLHLGLLVVALGLLVGALGGFRTRTPPLPPGQVCPVPGSPGASFFMGELEIAQHPDGLPRAYQVPITVLDPAGEVQSKGLVRSGGPFGLPGALGAYLYAYGPAVRVQAWNALGSEIVTAQAVGWALTPSASILLDAGRRLIVTRAPETGQYHVQLWQGEDLVAETVGAADEDLAVEDVRVRLMPSRYVVLELVRDPEFSWFVGGAVLALFGLLAAWGGRWRLVQGLWREGEIVARARARGEGSLDERAWSRWVRELTMACQGEVAEGPMESSL